MDAATPPETLTNAQRRAEIVQILARGLVRHPTKGLRLAPAEPPDSASLPLEASPDASVSVAPRPAR